MPKKRFFFALCLTSVFLVSCVSKERYVQLEANLVDTQARLDQEGQNLRDLKGRLEEVEAAKDGCQKDLTYLQTRYQDMERRNVDLSRQVDTLKIDLEKGKSTIENQKRVIQRLDETKREMVTALKKEVLSQEIKIEEMEGRLKVTFVDKILFDAGSAEIKKRGKALLMEIADALRDYKNQDILVQGHTDNAIIRGALKEIFPTNWELSVARATAVVLFLQEVGRIEPERLSACGYSFYRPLASNDTPEGRRQNRRIEITLVPSDKKDSPVKTQ